MAKRILVVEDEKIISHDIQRSLKALGYDVCGAASSGEEAIKSVAECKPDLVLMDIILRGQIDGVKAASHIRSMYNVPVVYLTSHSDKGTLKRARETGPFGYILKPFDDRELGTTIEMAIYSHRMEKMLIESEKWLSITLKSIADGVIVADSDLNVEFLNPSAEALTGWELKDALGRPLAEVFPLVRAKSEKPASDLFQSAFEDRRTVSADVDLKFVNRDGQDVPVEIKAAPIKDEEESIAGLVLTVHDITERMKAEEVRRKLIEELEHLSRTDRLTNLFNRGALIDHLRYEISRALRYANPLSLIICDIDHFKQINDTYGHLSGDRALKAVAEVLMGAVRETDIVGRYGGDEFMIVLPDTPIREAGDVAERIRVGVGSLVIELQEGRSAPVTMSLGCAEHKGRSDTIDALIIRADTALYESKRSGRNRFTLSG